MANPYLVNGDPLGMAAPIYQTSAEDYRRDVFQPLQREKQQQAAQKAAADQRKQKKLEAMKWTYGDSWNIDTRNFIQESKTAYDGIAREAAINGEITPEIEAKLAHINEVFNQTGKNSVTQKEAIEKNKAVIIADKNDTYDADLFDQEYRKYLAPATPEMITEFEKSGVEKKYLIDKEGKPTTLANMMARNMRDVPEPVVKFKPQNLLKMVSDNWKTLAETTASKLGWANIGNDADGNFVISTTTNKKNNETDRVEVLKNFYDVSEEFKKNADYYFDKLPDAEKEGTTAKEWVAKTLQKHITIDESLNKKGMQQKRGGGKATVEFADIAEGDRTMVVAGDEDVAGLPKPVEVRKTKEINFSAIDGITDNERKVTTDLSNVRDIYSGEDLAITSQDFYLQTLTEYVDPRDGKRKKAIVLEDANQLGKIYAVPYEDYKDLVEEKFNIKGLSGGTATGEAKKKKKLY